MSAKVVLHLDDPAAEFALESTVRGRVIVSVDQHRVGTLEIVFELVTTSPLGPPRALNEFGVSRTVHEGTWDPGAECEHTFEVEAPNTPPSYTGEVVQWAWNILARATFNDGDDVERSGTTVLLRAATGDWLKMEPEGNADPESVAKTPIAAGLISGSALAVSLAAIGLCVATGNTIACILGVIGALISALALHSASGVIRERRVVGNVQVDIQPKHGPIPIHEITAWTLPGAPVEAAVLELDVHECAEWGREDLRKVLASEVWSTSVVLESTAVAGVYRGQVELPSPDQVPFGLTGAWRSIVWTSTLILSSRDVELHRAEIPIRTRLAARPDHAAAESG